MRHPLSIKVGPTSPTSGGRSVGIVHSRTKATELSFFSDLQNPVCIPLFFHLCSSLCSFLQLPISSLFSPSIHLNTFLFNTLSVCSSLNVRNQICILAKHKKVCLHAYCIQPTSMCTCMVIKGWRNHSWHSVALLYSCSKLQSYAFV
jgi:hypothetical protein